MEFLICNSFDARAYCLFITLRSFHHLYFVTTRNENCIPQASIQRRYYLGATCTHGHIPTGTSSVTPIHAKQRSILFNLFGGGRAPNDCFRGRENNDIGINIERIICKQFDAFDNQLANTIRLIDLYQFIYLFIKVGAVQKGAGSAIFSHNTSILWEEEEEEEEVAE